MPQNVPALSGLPVGLPYKSSQRRDPWFVAEFDVSYGSFRHCMSRNDSDSDLEIIESPGHSTSARYHAPQPSQAHGSRNNKPPEDASPVQIVTSGPTGSGESEEVDPYGTPGSSPTPTRRSRPAHLPYQRTIHEEPEDSSFHSRETSECSPTSPLIESPSMESNDTESAADPESPSEHVRERSRPSRLPNQSSLPPYEEPQYPIRRQETPTSPAPAYETLAPPYEPLETIDAEVPPYTPSGPLGRDDFMHPARRPITYTMPAAQSTAANEDDDYAVNRGPKPDDTNYIAVCSCIVIPGLLLIVGTLAIYHFYLTFQHPTFIDYKENPKILFRRHGRVYETNETFLILEFPILISLNFDYSFKIDLIRVSTFTAKLKNYEKNVGDLLFRFDPKKQKYAKTHSFAPAVKVLATSAHSHQVSRCAQNTSDHIDLLINIETELIYSAHMSPQASQYYTQAISVCCNALCEKERATAPYGDIKQPTETKQAHFSADYTSETLRVTKTRKQSILVDGPKKPT